MNVDWVGAENCELKISRKLKKKKRYCRFLSNILIHVLVHVASS